MAIVYPTGYYDRTDPAKRFDKHLFLQNHILQSAEMNEIQDEANNRIKGVGDVFLRDGAPVRKAQIIVNSSTGVTAGEEGDVYIAGKVYAIPSATFTLSTSGSVSVGVYLTYTVISPEDDEDLYDPALGAGSYQEAGASRIQTVPSWGYEGDSGEGDFYSIYSVVDGFIQPYSPPPDVTPINQAVARYDIQSTGSNYVSTGMDVQKLPNDGDFQQFVISEGSARLQGKEMIFNTSRRVFFEEEPDLDTVVAETRTVGADDPFTVTVNRPPIASVTLITAQKDITAEPLTKAVGNYDSVAKRDSLVSVTSIYQSATTYTTPTHYTLTDSGDPPTNQIAWVTTSRPANGTTFYVSYAYTAQYPTDATLLANSSSTHIGIAGATQDSVCSVNYQYKVPRYDRLCLSKEGQAVLITGVAHPDRPVIPEAPRNLLPLAILYQTWVYDTSTISRDGVRMVPMNELESMKERIDQLMALVADCRVALYGTLLDPVVKRGLFTDSLHTNEMRDPGLENTAVINTADQTLMCGITWSETAYLANDHFHLPEGTAQVFLQQPLRSGTIQVNPYYSYADIDRIPAQVELRPNLDTWTVYDDGESAAPFYLSQYMEGSAEWTAVQLWMNNPTQQNTVNVGGRQYTIRETITQRTTNQPVPYLRPITVKFTLSGFVSEEPLDSVEFDGITVIPRAAP